LRLPRRASLRPAGQRAESRCPRGDVEAIERAAQHAGGAPRTPAGKASVQHLANIRSIVRRLAEESGLGDPESFARSWHILMKGVSAAEGDAEAAQRARSMARLLLEQHRGAQ
jgi:hypothetical protein